MAHVEHFEIPADDVERARQFYERVLGFRYERWDDDMGMILPPSERGIGGDIHKRSGLDHPTVVFTVDDIEQTVALAVEHGGEQVGEIQPLGEKDRWVYVRDSEGNTVGLFDHGGATA
ncbi:VOC family protein [Actinotalea sp. Marseille-Q4924]|uniref:VOC family protein n=1 Tax=Actinotalea sp. Marseille-Q4924 TaxID=2866571 RepID=UPI001CE46B7B|nr:VOC family protein [Actinotalea sp. Marseille-Q4924]